MLAYLLLIWHFVKTQEFQLYCATIQCMYSYQYFNFKSLHKHTWNDCFTAQMIIFYLMATLQHQGKS